MEIGGVVGWSYTCPKGLSYDPVGGICNWAAGLGCKEWMLQQQQHKIEKYKQTNWEKIEVITPEFNWVIKIIYIAFIDRK